MNKYFLPLFLALAFFVAEIITLSDYGINWDAPVHMMRGQAYAHFYLTGQHSYGLSGGLSPMIIKPGEIASRYYYIPEERWQPIGPLPDRPLFKMDYEKNTQGKRVSFYQSEIWNGQYWLKYDQPHLPLIDTLSAFSNRFFYGRLGWLGDIESYQLVYILISAFGVFLVSLFAYEMTGSWVASSVAGLSLALFPIYFAESHINMKDPEQAVFFLGAVWAFYHWVKDGRLGGWGRLGRFGGFIAFVALALATKWNIVFLPFILIPWLILIKFKDWGRLGRLGVLGGLGIIIFLILIWPAAWSDPAGKLVETIKYYLDIGRGENKLQPEGFIIAGFNFYPLIATLVQTPEIILVLGGIGVIRLIRGMGRDRLKVGYLLLAWLAVPIIRITVPGMNSYTGMRQIMEVVPAMAILAGVGAGYLVEKVKSLKFKVKNLEILFLLFTFYFLLVPIVKLYPNQNAYFNVLIRILPESMKTKLNDWGITYGNVYKQAVLWLNKNAPKNANVAHLQGSDFAISPSWLRDDISISPYHFSGFDQKGEYILSLYNPLNTPVFAKRYPEKFLVPIYKIEAGGRPLLLIYKNDKEFTKSEFNNQVILNNFIAQPKSEQKGDFWEVRLDKDYLITKILVENKIGCNKGIDFAYELIFFIPSNKINDELDPTQAFILNEKKDLGVGLMEYDFPAEAARLIKIYPLSNQSCFGQGKIVKIWANEYIGHK